MYTAGLEGGLYSGLAELTRSSSVLFPSTVIVAAVVSSSALPVISGMNEMNNIYHGSHFLSVIL